MNKITVDKISFSYVNDDSQGVFQELSVSFETGKINIVIGPNGVGKTTMLKCLTGYYTDYSGEILISNNISYVLDDPVLPMELRMFEYIDYVRKIANEKVNYTLKELLITLDLLKSNHKLIKNLSQGQKHKLAYAIALSLDADIYVLDEPLLFLDIKSQIALKNLINKLKANGKTFIISTHIISNAFELGDNAFLMKGSKIRKLKIKSYNFEEFKDLVISEV